MVISWLNISPGRCGLRLDSYFLALPSADRKATGRKIKIQLRLSQQKFIEMQTKLFLMDRKFIKSTLSLITFSFTWVNKLFITSTFIRRLFPILYAFGFGGFMRPWGAATLRVSKIFQFTLIWPSRDRRGNLIAFHSQITIINNLNPEISSS